MKKKKKVGKKKVNSIWNRLSSKLTECKDWLLYNLDNEHLLVGVLLVLFGAGLLQGWLNPVAWLGWLSITWGGVKVFNALR